MFQKIKANSVTVKDLQNVSMGFHLRGGREVDRNKLSFVVFSKTFHFKIFDMFML